LFGRATPASKELHKGKTTWGEGAEGKGVVGGNGER